MGLGQIPIHRYTDTNNHYSKKSTDIVKGPVKPCNPLPGERTSPCQEGYLGVKKTWKRPVIWETMIMVRMIMTMVGKEEW